MYDKKKYYVDKIREIIEQANQDNLNIGVYKNKNSENAGIAIFEKDSDGVIDAILIPLYEEE